MRKNYAVSSSVVAEEKISKYETKIAKLNDSAKSINSLIDSSPEMEREDIISLIQKIDKIIFKTQNYQRKISSLNSYYHIPDLAKIKLNDRNFRAEDIVYYKKYYNEINFRETIVSYKKELMRAP